MQEIIKHTLCVGLNDQHTLKQEIATDKAVDKIITACSAVYDGFTITQCLGCYTNKNGVFTQENSVKIEILFASDKKTYQIIDSLKLQLNQETIAVQVETITSGLL